MTITIEHVTGFVLVAVTDGSNAPPRQQPHDIHAARGRGLQLVAALSRRWDKRLAMASASRPSRNRNPITSASSADSRGESGASSAIP